MLYKQVHSRDETVVDLYSNFRALQRLSHDIVIHYPSFVASLREMKELRELRVGISVQVTSLILLTAMSPNYTASTSIHGARQI
jgi:hypothetical protein